MRCQCDTSVAFDDGLDGFRQHRAACRALREVLLPDSLWPGFVAACYEPQDRVHHRSILLLGYENGSLLRVTVPIHKFVLDRVGSGCLLSSQYSEDLQETWWKEDKEFDRNRKVKMYLGRISEFLVAEYLENTGCCVVDMEALGAPHDLIVRDPSKRYAAVEVKYVGENPDVSFQVLSASAFGVGGGSISAPNSVNFLLLKVFEAAKQLASCKFGKRVVLVVSPLEWSILEHPLSDGWVDWGAPTFCTGHEDWSKFLAELKAKPRFENIGKELQQLVASVESICVFRLGGDLSLEPVWEHRRVDT